MSERGYIIGLTDREYDALIERARAAEATAAELRQELLAARDSNRYGTKLIEEINGWRRRHDEDGATIDTLRRENETLAKKLRAIAEMPPCDSWCRLDGDEDGGTDIRSIAKVVPSAPKEPTSNSGEEVKS